MAKPLTSDTISAHLAIARPVALAALTRYFRRFELAEDALQEASIRAAKAWQSGGLPRDPKAWLITAGRNAGIDALRKDKRLVYGIKTGEFDETSDPEVEIADLIDNRAIRDDVLRLMFMCCQPELPPQDQLALALKVIGGMSVPEIARAFVVQPRTMEQRITRAKKKAAAIASRLETPSLTERTQRLSAVLAMIYLMFNEGYSSAGGDTHIRTTLCEEAIRLTRLILTLFPSQPEAMGLLALCLSQHARRTARIDNDGGLVRLEDQERSMWDQNMIAEARTLIEKALRSGKPGPYQIQAAIAAVHCAAKIPDDTDWPEIERLYGVLEILQPTPVIKLNRAVVVAKTKGPAEALALLEPLGDDLANYMHFHTTRGSLCRETGDLKAAHDAFSRALELGPNAAEASYIRKRIAELEQMA